MSFLQCQDILGANLSTLSLEEVKGLLILIQQELDARKMSDDIWGEQE